MGHGAKCLAITAPEPFREGGLGGDEGLLDVLGGVLARREEDVVVGVVGAGALEDLEVDLLPYLGVHLAVVCRGGGVISRSRMAAGARRVNPKDGRVNCRDEDSGDRVRHARGRRRAARRRPPRGREPAPIALTHSERLMAVVDRLLQDCGWAWRSWRRSRCPSAPARSRGSAWASPPSRGWPWRWDSRWRRCPRSTRWPRRCPSRTRRSARCSTRAGRGLLLALPLDRVGDGARVGLSGAPARGGGGAARRAGDRAGRRGRGVPAVSRPARRRACARPSPSTALPSPAVVAALGHAILAAGGGIPAEAADPALPAAVRGRAQGAACVRRATRR